MTTGLILLFLASCSPRLTPFTQELYDRQGWSEYDLRRIQFYLSEPIVLRRQMSHGESLIAGGKIRMVDGRRIEEVRIPARTPGVLLFMPKENRFAVSFEEHSDDLFLIFGPNPKVRNRYVLFAHEWERHHGRVHYSGNLYDIDARSAFAGLMVDLKRTGTTQYDTRKARGRKVE